jgi:hypothetical protein
VSTFARFQLAVIKTPRGIASVVSHIIVAESNMLLLGR